jgi:ribosomal RNA-processing protein 12
LTTLASGIRERLAEFEELVDGEEARDCQRDAEVLEMECFKLLPSLFKLVDTLHTVSRSGNPRNDEMKVDEDNVEHCTETNNSSVQQVQAVTKAIASLSRLAPKPFLQNLFKKVIQRLLEASQSDDDLSEKMCSLLSLAQALVVSESLDDSSVSLLYRSLKPLIRTDQTKPRVQKRAYKVMAEICQRYHSFTGDRLEELCELLTSSIVTSQISARHMRLKCLKNIVDGFDSSNRVHMVSKACNGGKRCLFLLKTTNLLSFQETISKLVGEVLLCLKDSNAKTREAAFQLLLSMANARGDLTDFFQLVTAALGAETTHMRSAAVMALSRLVFEYARDDPAVQPLLPSLLQTVLVLFDDTSREVIKSVVGFVRVSVAAMPSEQLEPMLPEVVNGLLKYHRGKDRFRAKIKIILKKLVKLYGFDALVPLVPEGDSRLLTHMRKLAERGARRKVQLRSQQEQKSVDFDDMIGSDEDDSDDGRTLMTGATGFTKMTGRTGKSLGTQTAKSVKSRSSRTAAESTATSKGSRANASIRLRNDADGEVFDVADLTAKSVRFAENDSEDTDSEGGAVEFDGAGKLVIRDDFEDNLASKGDNYNEDDEIFVAGKKRRLSRFESAKIEKEEQKKKQHSKSATLGLGASYRSKKAGGDVKRKGQKFEPYAYVPLDGRSYTKKNRKQAVEQMTTVVRRGGKRQKR